MLLNQSSLPFPSSYYFKYTIWGWWRLAKFMSTGKLVRGQTRWLADFYWLRLMLLICYLIDNVNLQRCMLLIYFQRSWIAFRYTGRFKEGFFRSPWYSAYLYFVDLHVLKGWKKFIVSWTIRSLVLSCYMYSARTFSFVIFLFINSYMYFIFIQLHLSRSIHFIIINFLWLLT